ncbi:DUF4153 domain-containing protein [Gracilimonas mengyeensis]|uniref:DUF4153 domain-containing protein n=1 Tax=Gracilimonas mengyeensis TaxID=1302730 RepID=A0A521CBM3_9BACT|nr:DUF4153 domain-containing protein [Gracilimonas mengyeensis]SMO56839.1 protein of unknown function [Gracilimonas mengyeensis]
MKIRFPSLSDFLIRSHQTVKRFPFVLAAAIIGSFSVVWLIDIQEGAAEFQHLMRLGWVSALSIPSFLAAAIFAESRNWSLLRSVLLKSALSALLIFYYLQLPSDFPQENSQPLYRFLLFAIAAHLLVSFSPYFNPTNKDNHSFWAYNKSLFLRIIMSGLYTMVLFAGLAIALLSIENLLEFELDSKRYGQLFVMLIGIFNTWFFLAGVPKPLQLTKKERAYPSGLKVFVQYILIPLVVIYILILYLYTGKIILQWAWPDGWVANLVLSFSIAGILALLLLYPIRDQDKNRWIHLFSKGYYLALIPLIILLILSIWVRIDEYGVTVNRYFVATLAVWLTGHVLYFLWKQEVQIKVIPISLCVVALIVSFGPWGAFQVSERSQLNRFEHLLQTHEMLSPQNTVIPSQTALPLDDRKQFSSIVRYLLELEGPETLQPYFEENLTKVLEQQPDSTSYDPSDSRKITKLMGIEYASEWEQPNTRNPEDTNFRFSLEENTSIPVTGYQYYLGTFHFGDQKNEPIQVSLSDGSTWNIRYNENSQSLSLYSTATTEPDSISLNLLPLIERLQSYETTLIPLETMTLESHNESLRIKAVIQTLNGSSDPEVRVNFITVALFADL